MALQAGTRTDKCICMRVSIDQGVDCRRERVYLTIARLHFLHLLVRYRWGTVDVNGTMRERKHTELKARRGRLLLSSLIETDSLFIYHLTNFIRCKEIVLS